MVGEELKQIIKKITQGEYAQSELSSLSELLTDANNEQLSQQLGKYNVNISEGKDIHIGDRIYHNWNEKTIQASDNTLPEGTHL